MGNKLSCRDKAILVGLYLSRFDDEGLTELGFDGIIQAFNVLDYSVGVKPASIKNYRDEFDPYFPNPRKGWHNRTLRDYCKKFLDDFSAVNFDDFTELIKSFLIPNYEIEKIERKDKSESVAKRLITGKSAEEYFKINYPTINQFNGYELHDTTSLACGFDFRLSQSADFYCVEVKGLNSNTGNILMTEKEFFVANKLKRQYCRFVVMNFAEKPYHEYFFDPLGSRLDFRKVERTVKQISYTTLL
ncbi:MAG: DUF3883 domain-containing protein [Rikenellaceae bacterium]|jgi:hypothetical protein|nr:DUF3883 domain-containing protein [Rikenellaceae bacterium]